MRYKNGSVAISSEANEIRLSQARHLIKTVLGERVLSPSFGIAVSMLYSTGIPEILTERIRLAFKQLQNIDAKVTIKSYNKGKLDLIISLSDSEAIETSF